MKLGILASGQGTNLQAIINGIEKGEIPAEISVVISDRSDAFALERARRHNLKAVYVNPANFHGREDFDREVIRILNAEEVELVILAGFMRLLSPVFVKAFPQRILNIHPSLLPAFPGLEGVKQALDYGVKVTGCTVHFVDEGLDTGPIILQEAVPVYDDDTVETLHQRIHEVEHCLYPQAITLLAQGKVTLKGRRCYIND